MNDDAPKRSVERPAPLADASFPRSARLMKHADFDRVYKQGRRHFSPHMTVFYLPHPESPGQNARVGFTVGKVLGGAVVRNRIKRRLREAVRQRRSILQVGERVDVVINPKKSLLTLEFSVVLAEVERALGVIANKLGAK